jgi:uncharacterized protein with GYD domain
LVLGGRSLRFAFEARMTFRNFSPGRLKLPGEFCFESAGGKMEALYFAFGDADFYIIYDAPDNVSAAALSVIANQSGFVTSKIIVLMTADDMDQAIQKSRPLRAKRRKIGGDEPLTTSRFRD